MGGGQLQETEAQLLSLALTEPGEGLSRDATASTGASHITGQDHPKAGHQSKPAPEGQGSGQTPYLRRNFLTGLLKWGGLGTELGMDSPWGPGPAPPALRSSASVAVQEASSSHTYAQQWEDPDPTQCPPVLASPRRHCG